MLSPIRERIPVVCDAGTRYVHQVSVYSSYRFWGDTGSRVVPRVYSLVPSVMKRRGFFVSWNADPMKQKCSPGIAASGMPDADGQSREQDSIWLQRKGEAMKEQLEKIKEEALRQIESSEALERLNDIRVSYLGKKG